MKDAVEKVLASGPASFSRTSSACKYWRRPAANAGMNVSRHRKGLLVECGDTNVLSKNTGDSQEEIDLRWNNMEYGCLRAFFFGGDCDDEMGVANGTPTAIAYDPCIRHWPGRMLRGLAAEFNGSTSKVNIGSAADIDNLQDLTIAAWVFVRSRGGNNSGTLFSKIAVGWIRLYVSGLSGGYVKLYGLVRCATTDAQSFSDYQLQLNGWHHVVMTWAGSGDRKIRFYIDGEETSYTGGTPVAGVGDQKDDSGGTAYVGSDGGVCATDGYISTFLLYNRVLSSQEIEYLSQANFYQGTGGDLRVEMREKWGRVDSSKISNGMVCFEFHDGYVAMHTKAKPVFDSHGVVGSLGIISSYIDTGGRLSTAQLEDFIAAGWEICSHSKTHPDHKNNTEEQLRTEYADSKAALEALGTTVSHYCYPYGAPQTKWRGICAEYYKSASGSGALNVLDNNMFTIGYAVIDNHAALETYKGYVDTAYSNNRLLIFMMHDVDDDDANTLEELIEYIQAKSNDMPIVTRDQAYRNMVFTPPEPLYKAFSVRCKNTHASSAKQLYQIKTLTVEEYIVSFLAYTDGSAVTSSDIVPFADTAFTNKISEFHYEDQGGGVYLCWGKFTATATDWHVGVEVKAEKTVYISLLTCVTVGTSMASGPYPRSPIANETTGSAARQADSLTIAGSSNFQPHKGTLDTEFYPLFPSDLSNSFQFYLADFYGGDGRIRLYKNDVDKIEFRVQANGDDDSVIGTISWNRGDRVRLRVVWNRDEKLDGTNYMLMYGKVNDGPWTQIGACSTQPTAPSSDQTLYVGRAGDSSGYEANSFISWLRIYDRPLLNPAW